MLTTSSLSIANGRSMICPTTSCRGRSQALATKTEPKTVLGSKKKQNKNKNNRRKEQIKQRKEETYCLLELDLS